MADGPVPNSTRFFVNPSEVGVVLTLWRLTAGLTPYQGKIMTIIQHLGQANAETHRHGTERTQARNLNASITMAAAPARRTSGLMDLPHRWQGLAMSGTPSPTGNPTGAEQ